MVRTLQAEQSPHGNRQRPQGSVGGSYRDGGIQRGTTVTTDAVAITNLLFRYAELMDMGDFAGAARLFEHARIRIGAGDGGLVDAAGILTVWESSVIRYPDGTPRTKHVTTNPIIEFEGDGSIAAARTYYTVFQQVDDFPLQPIIAGRYHDRLARVDGQWRFTERDYTLIDLVGDLSRHLRIEVAR
jgi:3-phenylpropionate/cinnamic acid dioxygenase small subunit